MNLKIMAITILSMMCIGNVMLNAAEEFFGEWENVSSEGKQPIPTFRIQNYSLFPLNITYQSAGQAKELQVESQGIIDIDYDIQGDITITTAPRWWQSALQALAPTAINVAAAFLGASPASAIGSLTNLLNRTSVSKSIQQPKKFPVGTRFVFYWPLVFVAAHYGPFIIPLPNLGAAAAWDGASARLETIMNSGVQGAQFSYKILKDYLGDVLHAHKPATEQIIQRMDNDLINFRAPEPYTTYEQYEQPPQ